MAPVILVVDDEPTNRSLLRGHLSAIGTVIEAADGAAGIEAVERVKPDLVLLDLMMPRLDGLAACREIKKRQAEPFLPVIIITALDEQSDRNRALEAGADDFVTKPFDRRELFLRVTALLRLREQDALIRKQVADIEALRKRQAELFHLLMHDLRNPLSGILGFLDLLATPGVAARESYVKGALDGARRLRTLLEDVLTVRSLEEGELSLHKEPVRLDVIAREAIETLQGAARQARVVLAFADGPAPVARVDRMLVRRAIENIVGNAIRYSKAGSSVELAVAERDDRGRIEVADRGPGIPDSLKVTVFEKFASVERSQGLPTRGFGLGLHLVDLVVRAHEGRVSVRDREGGGSVFTIDLPLADADA